MAEYVSLARVLEIIQDGMDDDEADQVCCKIRELPTEDVDEKQPEQHRLTGWLHGTCMMCENFGRDKVCEDCKWCSWIENGQTEDLWQLWEPKQLLDLKGATK